MRDDTDVTMPDTTDHDVSVPPYSSSARQFFAVPFILSLIAFFGYSGLLLERLTVASGPPPAQRTTATSLANDVASARQRDSQEEVFFTEPFSAKQFSMLTAQESLDGHPSDLLAQLGMVGEQNLVRLRCSDRIVHESGGFFIRESQTHAVTRKVTDDWFLEILRAADASVSDPHILLTARFCETEAGNLVLEYSTGTQPGHHPDAGENVTAALSFIERGKPFLSGIPMVRYDVWPYPGCRRPLLMTKNGLVFYECGLVGTQEVNATYHRVDFTAGTSEQVAKCIYTYKGGAKKTCEEK